jgi:tryptophan synthase beta chain
LLGFQLLAETEGIIPALEPAHVIGWLMREAGQSVPTGSTVLITMSGRGDKDAAFVAERLSGRDS